ncbi:MULTISPECIES: LysR family transcriptional regulator [unclassified Pseudomonas]|uniref:LysR family transcriptional regulator n=1 Tax=unclassified Pseudomonas TaxID=196821 RepID=UPI002AC9DC49|nr:MULTISPECIES: LysR family transcriptional regulator [unclassified Pseudomonas]MEB0047912.1 LysR family transcriptional regulator [Pseudomonas sp. Dout3]MEB0098813.1 LysR family transcriptional regulator [Pseudomonas sp. DC1.2]WPX59159.1 LysR family transcriptional regulator [Pseudomonas sp. DC1.2]
MHIDLRQLRHFIALADQRSFVAGALAVNLSQSAFSRSIQALEHSVGCQLVDRGRKDLAPTKQGQVLLEHARRLVSGAQQMANEISQFNGLEAGELHFGCGPAPAAGLIPRAIGHFIGRYPKARVQFQVDDWQSLSKRLLSEEFEFFVADTRSFEADPQYLTQRLRPRKWHFCCRIGHPLAGRERVSAAELMSYPMAVSIRPPNLRKVLVDLSGRPDFKPNVECENSYSLLSVVMHSDAIGIVGAYSDALHTAKGELVCLKIEGLADDLEALHTRYGIVSLAGYRLSPLAEAMIAQIKAIDAQDEDVCSLDKLAV